MASRYSEGTLLTSENSQLAAKALQHLSLLRHSKNLAFLKDSSPVKILVTISVVIYHNSSINCQ